MSTNTCKPLDPKLVQYLLDTFTADFSTGCVFWKVNGKKKKAGDELPRRLCTSGDRNQRHFYRVSVNFNNKSKTLALARVVFILWHQRDVKPGHLLDHINRVSTDDTAKMINGKLTLNLRELTPSENMLNSGSHRGSSSKFKGVHLDKVSGKYRAQYNFMKDGQRLKSNLGNFEKEEDAARAYDRAVLEQSGDIAFTNFPISDYPDIKITKRTATRFRGVVKSGNKFAAQFMSQGQSYYGGRFASPGEAFSVTQTMRQSLGLKPYPQPVQGV